MKIIAVAACIAAQFLMILFQLRITPYSVARATTLRLQLHVICKYYILGLGVVVLVVPDAHGVENNIYLVNNM